jgi:hypothetical protein
VNLRRREKRERTCEGFRCTYLATPLLAKPIMGKRLSAVKGGGNSILLRKTILRSGCNKGLSVSTIDDTCLFAAVLVSFHLRGGQLAIDGGNGGWGLAVHKAGNEREVAEATGGDRLENLL